MQQLVIHFGKVIATHSVNTNLRHAQYPVGCEIVLWDGHIDSSAILPPDPRTDEQKAMAYKNKRRMEYPPIEDQLDMIFYDRTNGTDVWFDSIKSVKEKYPKSKEK